MKKICYKCSKTLVTEEGEIIRSFEESPRINPNDPEEDKAWCVDCNSFTNFDLPSWEKKP